MNNSGWLKDQDEGTQRKNCNRAGHEDEKDIQL